MKVVLFLTSAGLILVSMIIHNTELALAAIWGLIILVLYKI